MYIPVEKPEIEAFMSLGEVLVFVYGILLESGLNRVSYCFSIGVDVAKQCIFAVPASPSPI